MQKELPDASGIQVERDIGSTTYSWRDLSKRHVRIGDIIGASLTACVLAFAEVSLVYKLISDSQKGEVKLYSLIGAVVLGFFIVLYCCFMYFAVFNPKRRPFKLVLSPGKIKYELGYINIDFSERKKIKDFNDTAALFKKIKMTSSDFETSKISNLKLEPIGEKERLSFDYGADRIEVGETLSQPEREWLYEVLREHITK